MTTTQRWFNEIKKNKFTDLFVQGEGWDKHEVYGHTKDGKYYLLGTTKNEWATEDFRYPDTDNCMWFKIQAALGGV